jgi:large subunit ribosomal protein L10
VEEPRPEKVAVVEEVRERFAGASAAILTEYRGLKVQEMQTLRRALTAAGGEYKVYKNTLVRRAARDIGLADLEPMLEGPTAIAFVRDDVAAVAKVLREFSRTTPALVVKGGLVGRSLFDAKGAARLADLPSREVLLSQIAGALAAPLQKLAALMKALPQNLAYGLSALIDSQGGVPAESLAPATEPSAPEAGSDETASGSDDSVAGGEPEVAAGDDEDAEAVAPEVGTATESGSTDAAAAPAEAEADSPTEAAVTTQPPAGEEAEPSAEGAAAEEAADEGGTAPTDGAEPEAVS